MSCCGMSCPTYCSPWPTEKQKLSYFEWSKSRVFWPEGDQSETNLWPYIYCKLNLFTYLLFQKLIYLRNIHITIETSKKGGHRECCDSSHGPGYPLPSKASLVGMYKRETDAVISLAVFLLHDKPCHA